MAKPCCLTDVIYQQNVLHILSFLEQIEHIDWHDHYVHLRSAAGIEFPGLFQFLTASDLIEAAILGIPGIGCWLAVAS